MTTVKTYQNWALHNDAQNIAWLTIDCPDRSMNALASDVMEELADIIGSLEAAPPKALIIRSGKRNGFIAGADVKEFQNVENVDNGRKLIERGWHLFNRIEKLAFPTLALMHGPCLGGGLELALACRYRIAIDSPKPVIGLPEVKLGIFPAWGGLMRLPRLIGPQTALNMMLTGRTLDGRKARSAGLVDLLVAPRVAEKSAIDLVTSGKPARQARGLAGLLNRAPFKSLVAAQARKSVKQKDPYGHYPATLTMLDLWEKHDGDPLADPQALTRLLQSDVTRNLIRVFHLQERLKAFGKKDNATPVNHVHVIGAGVMGGGIAAWCALQGIKTTLQDTDAQRIAGAFKNAVSIYARKDRYTAQAARDRLIPDLAGHGIATADLVIEAISENPQAKQSLYQQIEPKMKEGAILATNTSSLSIAQLRSVLVHPERFVGIHFFNPVSRMPLVEVVHADGIAQETLDTAAAFVGKIGKLPLPVQDTPGFLVNAVLAPYMLQAMRCIDEGMDPEVIDTAMLEFGMPMGPITLADTVGLDIAMAAGKQLSEGQEPPRCLQEKIAQGKLGVKSGEGFYVWKDRKHDQRSSKAIPQGLAQRLIKPLIEQTEKQLANNIVQDADLADAGVIFGTGFAPFTGGPIHYKQSKGGL